MKYVRLGGTNLTVSEFCLGTMMFGGKTAPEEGIRIIRRAVEAGVNFVDTADVYNAGQTETIVGQALQASATRWCWPARAPCAWARGRTTSACRGSHRARRRGQPEAAQHRPH
jgi:diketogulonate reductase-like aldo/keto reductase